ncbi:hypothetical protein ACNKHR_04265 [Shigella flexneri]
MADAGAGYCGATACPGDRWHFGSPDTRPPETQNRQEKEANGLDPEVLAEINREREAFLQHSREVLQRSCLPPSKACTLTRRACDHCDSVPFDGKATLFVAERTLQEGMSPDVLVAGG